MLFGGNWRSKPRTFGEIRTAVSEKTTTPNPTKTNSSKDSIEVLPEYLVVQQLIEEQFPLVFVTGGAGTGKSTFIRWLDERFSGRTILCAPTGIAALTIRGKTVHSLCKFPPAWIVQKDIRVIQKTQEILKQARVLVIDEISMVNANLLDSLHKFLRLNRNDESPFGGISVVMVGDLYQLPPVVTSSTQGLFRAEYSSPRFFAAHCISSTPFRALEFTKPYRQADTDFVELLNDIRSGHNLEEALLKLNSSAHRTSTPPDGAVWLCPRNVDVERVNAERLSKIQGEEREYRAVITGVFRESQLPVPSTIQLKVGAQIVMANNTKQWVNGSIAIVRELNDHNIKINLIGESKLLEVQPHQWDQFDYALNKDTGDIERTIVGSYRQLPVNLSWAMTIHKSQGQTLAKVHLDLGAGAFETGQVYVALSRCRKMEDLSLAADIRLKDIKVDPEASAFYEEIFK